MRDLIRVVLPTCTPLMLNAEHASETYTWRTNDGDDDGRGLLWEAVHEWNMQTFLFDLAYVRYVIDSGVF